MISCIKTDRGHSEGNNIFVIEYSIAGNNIEYKFDVDVSNYGNEIAGIKAKSDEEVHCTERIDVIDEQLGFVADSSLLSDLGKLLNADSSLDAEKKIQYLQNKIDEFCNQWGVTHNITK